MTLPVFPEVEDILTIIMGELPQGVYAQDRANDPDPDNRSYSSSELRAGAQMIANLYANLEDIWENKWISTVNPDGLSAWETELFGSPQNAALPFATRQANLLAKRRAQGSIALPAIAAIVSGLLQPLGLSFAILPYSGQYNGTEYGAWILGFSQLGMDTFLSLEDPLYGTGLGVGETPLDCSLNYAAAGLTAQDLANIQATAYTYEVQIYGNADANTLALMNTLLTEHEPARSTHIITNNASGPVSPNVLDCGPPGSNTIIDSIDCGPGSRSAATYDVLDFAL